VRKGVPFRNAHAIVGRAVRQALEQGKELAQLSLEELQGLSPAIENDVFEALSLEGSINSRNHIGGTAPAQVRVAAKRARERLAK
jgi:argininosuccinate lyase